MSVILSLMAGAFIGFVLAGVLFNSKSDDICFDCPYKNYYFNDIAGLND